LDAARSSAVINPAVDVYHAVCFCALGVVDHRLEVSELHGLRQTEGRDPARELLQGVDEPHPLFAGIEGHMNADLTHDFPIIKPISFVYHIGKYAMTSFQLVPLCQVFPLRQGESGAFPTRRSLALTHGQKKPGQISLSIYD